MGQVAKESVSTETVIKEPEPEPEPTSKPEPEPTPKPEPDPSPPPPSKKLKKKRKTHRPSPYNIYKKRMMNSEEIKSVPSRERFKWVAQRWKKDKERLNN